MFGFFFFFFFWGGGGFRGSMGPLRVFRGFRGA